MSDEHGHDVPIMKLNAVFVPEGEVRLMQVPVGLQVEVVITARRDDSDIQPVVVIDLTTGLDKDELVDILELVVDGLKKAGEPVASS